MLNREKNTSPAYSIGIRFNIPNVPGVLGELCVAIGKAGGNIISLGGFDVHGNDLTEDILVDCRDEKHMQKVVKVVEGLKDVEVLNVYDRTFRLHEGGKIEVTPLLPLQNQEQLSMAYTPGVARICNAIHEDPEKVYDYTIKKNTVAIVTDGTAVLGLGNIGPKAALPVMEGKALLFKEFAGIDAVPICLDVSSEGDLRADELVESIARLAPVFGGINLEDIAAPICFEVEERLQEMLDIPVFHDDQHGTAVVLLGALKNALKIVGKNIEDINVAIAGAGAAGVAIAKIIKSVGVSDIIGVDKDGIIDCPENEKDVGKLWFEKNTNKDKRRGRLSDAVEGADVFIGVSAKGILSVSDVKSMANKAIVFAMANPEPEIRPEEIEGLAVVIATGRSDYPNQINNVLAFPGIFRGALDARATAVTEEMKLCAADALANCVSASELSPEYIIPSVFDKRVVDQVAKAVVEVCPVRGVAAGSAVAGATNMA